MHNEQHPNAGKYFWLNLKGTQCLPSPEDLKMPFRLLDWADRMDSLENYSLQQKDNATQTYFRRCIPINPFSADGNIIVGQLRGGILLLIHESELAAPA